MFSVPEIEDYPETNYIKGAHRGSSIDFVENTLDAFAEAVNDDQYQFVEYDIQYTKDGKIVVFHDLSLFRFQKQMFKVKDLTYEELVELSRYNVPLYEEVMDIIGDKKRINIEIKSQGDLEQDKKLVEFVLEDCQKRGISNQILFSSISKDVVKYIKTAHPELKVGQIFLTNMATYFTTDYFTLQFYDMVEQETGADYIMLHGQNLRNIASLMKLKPADKTLVFWYFDDQMYVMQDGNELSWG